MISSHYKRWVIRNMLPLQDGLCWWHGALLIIGSRDKRTSPTIEHLRHKSKGGSYELDNLVVSCVCCNHARADKDHWQVHPLLRSTPRFQLLGGSHSDLFDVMRQVKPPSELPVSLSSTLEPWPQP